MELYHNPANLFVAGFLGAPSMNFLSVQVSDTADGFATVGNASLDPIRVATRGRDIRSGGRATLGVRPQYLHPTTSDDGMLHGRVAMTERLGSETVVDIELRDGSKMIAAIAEDRILKPGSEIGFTFDPDQAHLFAEAP
jgi:multiple sugar transport system ATP-binding protein